MVMQRSLASVVLLGWPWWTNGSTTKGRERNFRRRELLSGESPPACGNGLSARDVSRSHAAIKLARIVNDGIYTNNIDDLVEGYGLDPNRGLYRESGLDAVYLARVDEAYCGAAFRGTSSRQPADWFTNLVLGPVPFALLPSGGGAFDGSDDLGGCDMHKGYHDAYAEFEHRELVESFLEACTVNCPGCEILLTGHSQGGSIAEIAALYRKQQQSVAAANETTGSDSNHDLYVITFGAPQGLGAGCESLVSEAEGNRWFRYVMATEGSFGNKLVYDPIPLLYAELLDTGGSDVSGTTESTADWFDWDWQLPGTDQTYARNGGLAFLGREILLSTEDARASLVSTHHRFVDLSSMDFSGTAHLDSVYARVLAAQEELYGNRETEAPNDAATAVGDGNSATSATAGDQVLNCTRGPPADGFAVGTLCNPDEEDTTCGGGTMCRAERSWLFWESSRHTCQSRSTTTTAPPPPPYTANTDQSLASEAMNSLQEVPVENQDGTNAASDVVSDAISDAISDAVNDAISDAVSDAAINASGDAARNTEKENNEQTKDEMSNLEVEDNVDNTTVVPASRSIDFGNASEAHRTRISLPLAIATIGYLLMR